MNLICSSKFKKKKTNLECNFEKLGIDINLSLPKILKDINKQRLSNNPILIDNEIIKRFY